MANIEEILFMETDGACAYCGIKDYRVLTVHHIIQQEPKDESYGNKIILCHNCHHLYHQNKGPTETDIRTIKKRLIYKTLTQQGVNALKEAYRKGIVVASSYLVNHLVELQFLRHSDTLSEYINEENGEMVGSVIDAVYELTDEGKQFVQKWNI